MNYSVAPVKQVKKVVVMSECKFESFLSDIKHITKEKVNFWQLKSNERDFNKDQKALSSLQLC